jgi:ATP-dependent HslUV protease ATP-binding subunit HslU
VRILTEPRNALIKQYIALMATEGVTLDITPDAIERLAELATMVNDRTENIGARRLHTVMERLLDEVSFHASEMEGCTVRVDQDYVDRMLQDIARSDDLSRYIL